jgi:PhzF family phenazine biosynthesis protein
MQLVVREMNLSETAFVSARATGFDLRWFTPTTEVDLCGHATLAAAHALWAKVVIDPHTTARFFTRSGELTAKRAGEGIALDFPTEAAAEVQAPDALVRALGVPILWVGASRFDYLCELESEAAVRGLVPDLPLLATVQARGVIVTARGSGRYDFVSRFFAPAAGVPEDPVTGSAHCTLGPHWAARLGRQELVGWQASTRGGLVGVTVRGARTQLVGRAFTIAEGRLRTNP